MLGRALVVVVYIAEAHAEDEWPIGSKYNGLPSHNQPKTTEERIAIAKGLRSGVKACEPFSDDVQIVVDTQNNDFDLIYAAWPVRFFIIQNKRLQLKTYPKNGMYDIADIHRWFKQKTPP